MKIINTALRLFIGTLLVPGVAISDKFSIVVVPDTQLYAERFPAIINAQMQWIADKQVNENIIYVTQLGDLKDDTRCDNKPIAFSVGGTRTEWDIVEDAFEIIENKTSAAQPNGIPYGTVAGNHDFEQVSGLCPTNWNDPDQRSLTTYNSKFGPAQFTNRAYYGGSRIEDDPSTPEVDEGSNEDNFTLFESGGVKFIAINLGYREGPNPNDVLNPDGTVAVDNSPEQTWADGLLKTHDDRIGIITSHYFMRCNKLGPGFCGTAAGTPLNSNGSYGTQVYDRLKNNKNLFMMLGAHKRGEAYRLETRSGMQPVHIMLANYQSMLYPSGDPGQASTFSTLQSASNGFGDSGFMRIMRFDTDTGNVDIETFSPPVPATPAAEGTGDQSLCITSVFPPPPLPDGVVCGTPAIAVRSLLRSVYNPDITGTPALDNGLHTGSASNMSGIPFTGYAEVTTPAIINVTASGGSVPENNAAGATFNLTVPNGGVISNVTLDLFNFVRNGQSFLPPSGGIVELIMRLTHVDTGTTATIINHPLNSARFICIAGLNGDYTFDSSSGNTLNAACGSGDVRNQPRTIAPGTFRPVSDLSTLFDGEDAAGTWRLFVSDTIINTGAGQFVTNNNWRWGLNITVD